MLLRPLLLSLFALAGTSQGLPSDVEAARQETLREGLALYEVERASWVSDDVLQEQSNVPVNVITFLSYPEGDSVRTAFIGMVSQQPTVVLQVSYPRQQLNADAARVHQLGRPLTDAEERLFRVQQDVLKRQRKLTGGKVPQGTTYNIAVLDHGSSISAYLLLGATAEGLVPLGADMRLTYSPDGRLQQQQKLHSGFVPITPAPAGTTAEGSVHTHLPGLSELITPTDICTLLLYRDALGPAHKQHVVLSEKYTSVFDLNTRELRVLLRAEFEQTLGHTQR